MTETDFLLAFNKPLVPNEHEENPFKDATRPAAVLICLFKNRQKLHVLFTERASHLKHHAGQISFPGGKAEKADASLVETAFREAQEEIGLIPQNLQLLGRISTYRTISGFAVAPIVALYKDEIDIEKDLIIDSNEVAQAFSVPLEYLMEPSNYLVQKITRGEHQLPVYFIRYEQYTIWGATAGMLAQLQQHISDDL
jgi:8-oxo-dGTP pyrophosphatase MutT (NUDIX family)